MNERDSLRGAWWIERDLAQLDSMGPACAEMAAVLRIALGHLTAMKTSAARMIAAGATAEQLRAMAFVQSTLAGDAIDDFKRAHDPLFKEDTQH